MTKYKAFIKYTYIICGLFGFIAYSSYLIKQFIWYEGKLPMIAAVLGVIIAGVPVFFRSWFEKVLPKKLFAFLESLFAYGMLFYCVTFAALSVYIFSAGSMQTDTASLPDKTVFVVYGAGLRGEEPGGVLKKRLDRALECMTSLPDSVCIVTGGQGSNELVSEAYAMKRYLTEHGIAPQRIITEDKSHNTIENIRFSYDVIKENGLEGYTVVSLSNSFHIPRIELICKRLGADGRFVLAKDPNPYTMFTVLVREYMSYAKLFLFGTDG